MSEVTGFLNADIAGDRQAAAAILPLVYDELRRVAAILTAEIPGHTLNSTSLVHEAYLRLVRQTGEQGWDSGKHFFGAAAEATRRIRHGGAQSTSVYGRWFSPNRFLISEASSCS